MDNGTFQIKSYSDLGLATKRQPIEKIVEAIIPAPELAEDTEIPGLHLALMLDRSGSMNGEKLPYVKQAGEHVLNLLLSKDWAAVVVFDEQVYVIRHQQYTEIGR
jgi:Ca-activated chloride channel family protein